MLKVLAIDDDQGVHDAFHAVLVESVEAARPDRFADLLATVTGQRSLPAKKPPSQITLHHAHSGEAGLELVRKGNAQSQGYDVAIVDMRMPGGWDGLKTIRELQETSPTTQLIICTAYSDYDWKAINEQIQRPDTFLILKKPFDGIELQQMVLALGEKVSLERSAAQTESRMKTILAEHTLLLAGTSDFIYRVNSLGRISYVSPALERVIGATEEQWADFFHQMWPEGREPFSSPESVIFSAHGQEHTLELAERIDGAGWIGVGRDITQRAALERRLRQAEKMEAVGRLAGGVAHDFNNLLTMIAGEAELLEYDFPEAAEPALTLQRAAAQGGALTRRLLLFSSEPAAPAAAIDISALVEDSARLFRRVVPENINIELSLLASERIWGSASELSRVIMNLVINAADAMPRGGALHVATADVRVDADSYQRLTISDTGHGMSADVRKQIFSPFFSTKGKEGTGLGMQIVAEIVEELQGTIRVDSEVDRGSHFELTFPSYHAHEQDTESEMAYVMGSGEVVIVVEDNSDVSQLTIRALEKLGYSTHRFDDPREAEQMPDELLAQAALVLTDVVMPHLSGAELKKKLLKRRPSLPVLFVSGYAGKELNMAGSEPEFLRKPWTLPQLSNAVEQLLKKQSKL